MNKLILAAAAFASLTAAPAFAESRNLEIQSQRMLENQQRAGSDATPSRSFSARAQVGSPVDPRVGQDDATGISNPIGQSKEASEVRRLLHGN